MQKKEICPKCNGERCKVIRIENITVAVEICKECMGLGFIIKE